MVGRLEKLVALMGFVGGCAYGIEPMQDPIPTSLPEAAFVDETCMATKLVGRLVEIDESFTSDETDMVKLAAKKWDTGLGFRTLHVFSHEEIQKTPNWFYTYERQITHVVNVIIGSELDKTLDTTPDTLGLTQYNTVYLWPQRIAKTVMKADVSKLFYSVILHELGHDMYLTHIDNPNGVMWYEMDINKTEFDHSDFVEFCSKWHCTAGEIELASKTVSCNVVVK